MAEIILLVALGIVIYAYAGYPLLLVVWHKLAARPVRKQRQELTVSLIITMHNEAQNVITKLQNCFDLDYPADKLQIIASLDAPTDGTDQLVRDYGEGRIDVTCSLERRGKAVAMNQGVAIARGDIVVFADARQRFDQSAIRELVANFADESVGAVSGELVLLDSDGYESASTVGMYWRYEKALRLMEGRIHSVPGLTGAICAIRRNLFAPLPPQTVLDDLVIPLRIILDGKRAVFEPLARAYDTVSENPALEYEKKRRTLMGNYEILAEMPELCLPWRNPIFVQFMSHKVARLVTPYCLAAVFLSNMFVLRGPYLILFTGQILWYSLACAGWFFSAQPSPGSASEPSLKRLENKS